MLKNIVKTFLIFFFIFTYISSYSIALEDVNDTFTGTYLIKNIKSGEYLRSGEYVNDCNKKVRCPFAKSNISEESLFTFEKRAEGYLIKTVHSGEYLYCAMKENWGVISRLSTTITENSYFSLYSKNCNQYVIKNKKYKEYLKKVPDWVTPMKDFDDRCYWEFNKIL